MPLSKQSLHAIHTANAQKSLLQLSVDQDAALRKILSDASQEASRLMARLSGSEVGQAVRSAQYAVMRKEIQDIAVSTWNDQIATEILGNLSTATQMAVNANKKLLEVLARAAPKDAALLADSMMRSAERTFAGIRARALNNIDLSTSVYNNTALMAGKVDEVVNNGILLGQSAAEIAQSVSQYIDPNVVGGTSYNANRLARTELNNSYRTVSTQTYDASPYVDAVEWIVSGSHTDEDECDDLANADDYGLGEGVYPTDAVPDGPHPNCFCYEVPIGPTPDEFVNNLVGGDYACG